MGVLGNRTYVMKICALWRAFNITIYAVPPFCSPGVPGGMGSRGADGPRVGAARRLAPPLRLSVLRALSPPGALAGGGAGLYKPMYLEIYPLFMN
jgi:hypothetical protein